MSTTRPRDCTTGGRMDCDFATLAMTAGPEGKPGIVTKTDLKQSVHQQQHGSASTMGLPRQ